MLEDDGDLRQLQVTETYGGISWLLQFRLRERMKGRDGERSGLNTLLLPVAAVCQRSVTEKHNRRQMKSLQFALCVPPLYLGGLFVIAQKFTHITANVYKRKNVTREKNVVTPLKRLMPALVHLMQFKFSEAVQLDHYTEVLFCVTVCSQPADRFELRMCVVIRHNSVQREIRAFTFSIISK